MIARSAATAHAGRNLLDCASWPRGASAVAMSGGRGGPGGAAAQVSVANLDAGVVVVSVTAVTLPMGQAYSLVVQGKPTAVAFRVETLVVFSQFGGKVSRDTG